jgi:preprotein translocase subunit SecY
LVGRRLRQRKVEKQEVNVQMRPMATGPQGVASMHIRQIMATMPTMVRMLMQPIGTGVVVVVVVVVMMVMVMMVVVYMPLVHRRVRVADRRRRNGNRHQHGC